MCTMQHNGLHDWVMEVRSERQNNFDFEPSRVSSTFSFLPEILYTPHCSISQGNYATQDSSGMCHLIPWQHLPEWREEDEQAFVHRGIWISNKGLDNTMPAIVNCIYMMSQ